MGILQERSNPVKQFRFSFPCTCAGKAVTDEARRHLAYTNHIRLQAIELEDEAPISAAACSRGARVLMAHAVKRGWAHLSGMTSNDSIGIHSLLGDEWSVPQDKADAVILKQLAECMMVHYMTTCEVSDDRLRR